MRSNNVLTEEPIFVDTLYCHQ